MSIKRLTVSVVLASVLFLSGSLQAKTTAHKVHRTHHSAHVKTHHKTHSSKIHTSAVAATPSANNMIALPQLGQRPLFNLSSESSAAVPASFGMVMAAGTGRTASTADVAVATPAADGQSADNAAAAPVAASDNITDLRKALIAMAMKLRDVRYVRGGHDPSTGFDCSGFVRYVFAHAVGMQLPTNSAAQFLAGLKVKRADMKPGDLVFFRTHGKRRISHVGIYISNGRFIHSPTTGKSVEISSLDSGYWAKRFAGAKRPEAMALVADKG